MAATDLRGEGEREDGGGGGGGGELAAGSGGGCVSFSAGVGAGTTRAGGTYGKEEVSAMKGIFNLYDADNSGTIGMKELEAILQKVGHSPGQPCVPSRVAAGAYKNHKILGGILVRDVCYERCNIDNCSINSTATQRFLRCVARLLVSVSKNEIIILVPA